MDGDENEYQFQPPHVGFLPQVLLKVEIGHVLIDETEWVRLSRVHPHERHYIHIAVVKEAPYVNFVVKSLQRSRQHCTRDRPRFQRTAMT